MANDSEELAALRRLKELEDRSGGVQPPTGENDMLKKAAPFYMGPFGTARAARDVLHGVDELTTRAGYKAGELASDTATGFGFSPETSAAIGVGYNMLGQAGVSAGLGSLVRAPVAMQNLGRRIMQSVVKPEREARLSGKADTAINTMLERKISGTEGGRDLLKDRIGELEGKIQGILDRSTGLVDRDIIAGDALTGALSKVKNNLDVRSDTKAITETIDKFKNHPQLGGAQHFPVKMANEMKQSLYRTMGEKPYGSLAAKSTAETIAEKWLAKGLRENVGRMEPGVVPSLAEQSELINALKVMSPRVSVEGNKNQIGIGIVSPSVEKLVVWLADRSPWFKSKLAQTAYHGTRLPQELATAGVAAESGLRQKRD